MADDDILKKLEALRKQRIELTGGEAKVPAPIDTMLEREKTTEKSETELRDVKKEATLEKPAANEDKQFEHTTIEKPEKTKTERPTPQTPEPVKPVEKTEPKVIEKRELDRFNKAEAILEKSVKTEIIESNETTSTLKVNIARGTIEETKGKPALPKPPTPPYAKQAQETRASFFSSLVGKQEDGKTTKTTAEKTTQTKTVVEKPVAVEAQEFATDIVKEEKRAQQEAAQGHAHRAYLNLGKPATTQATTQKGKAGGEEEEMAKELLPEIKKVNAEVPKEAAQKPETHEAVASAHAQMEQAAKPESRRERKEEEKKTQASKQSTPAPEEKPLTLDDIIGPAASAGQATQTQAKPSGLFGELEKTTAATGGAATGSLFGELANVAGGQTEPKANVTPVKIESDSALACPTCKAQNTRVIFCPYCGTGTCANCSPNIKPEGDLFIFTCPKCGEGINVPKKK